MTNRHALGVVLLVLPLLTVLPHAFGDASIETTVDSEVHGLFETFVYADAFEEKKWEALEDLRRMGDKCFPALCTRLEEARNPIEEMSVISLLRILDGDHTLPLETVRGLLQANLERMIHADPVLTESRLFLYIGERGGKQDIPLLHEYEQAKDQSLRTHASSAIGRIETTVKIRSLLDGYASSPRLTAQQKTKQAELEAMAQATYPILPILCMILKEEHPPLYKAWIVNALNAIEPDLDSDWPSRPGTLPAVRRMLEMDAASAASVDVQRECLRFFERFGDEQDIEQVAAWHKAEHAEIKAFAEKAREAIRFRTRIKSLLDSYATATELNARQSRAQEKIVQMGADAVPTLLFFFQTKFESRYKAHIIDILGRIDGDHGEALRLVREVLDVRAKYVQAPYQLAALRYLSEHGDASDLARIDRLSESRHSTDATRAAQKEARAKLETRLDKDAGRKQSAPAPRAAQQANMRGQDGKTTATHHQTG